MKAIVNCISRLLFQFWTMWWGPGMVVIMNTAKNWIRYNKEL